MIRILYIEDNPDNRALVRRVLTAEGMEVIEAANAPDGLVMANTHHPDLILMDMNMPGMKGTDATKLLRADPELKHIPVIAVTANVVKGAKEDALNSGMNGYIAKPIDVDRFPNEIRKYLSRMEA